MNEVTPEALYRSHLTTSLDGTWMRLQEMAAVLRGAGYLGQIRLIRPVMTPTNFWLHSFALYHPRPCSIVRAARESITGMLVLTDWCPHKHARPRTTNFRDNRGGLPILDSRIVLPHWAEICYLLPLGGAAPQKMMVAEVGNVYGAGT